MDIKQLKLVRDWLAVQSKGDIEKVIKEKGLSVDTDDVYKTLLVFCYETDCIIEAVENSVG